MINYWWNTVARASSTRRRTRCCTRCSACAIVPSRKNARGGKLFDYYVFGRPSARARICPSMRAAISAPMDEHKARRLRAYLLSRLNRLTEDRLEAKS